jgi:hypothetical protein
MRISYSFFSSSDLILSFFDRCSFFYSTKAKSNDGKYVVNRVYCLALVSQVQKLKFVAETGQSVIFGVQRLER